MGIWLANAQGLHIHKILHFKEDLTVILISTLFIVLAARLDMNNLPYFGAGVIVLIGVAQFVIRPLNIWICTFGSDLSSREKLFLAWIAPRGIVAAAVSSLFALRLQEVNMAQTEYLVPLTFCLIIGTVVIQSFTAKPLADKLGISNPAPNGVLIHGVNTMSLALANSLRQHAIKLQFSDTSWSKVRKARQSGFEAYHGNPTSGHAEENLDLQGIGKLLALSSSRDMNALAGIHFTGEFGSNAVFTLESASDDDVFERFDPANRHRANPLFDSKLSYSMLKRMLREGEVRHVVLPEPAKKEETPNAVADLIAQEEIKMFAINKDRKLFIYGSGEPFTPKAGWTIIVLTPPNS